MDRLNLNEDVMFSLLRSQVNVLSDVLRSLEEEKEKPLLRNTHLNEYVHENIKNVEKDLRWFRKSFLNN